MSNKFKYNFGTISPMIDFTDKEKLTANEIRYMLSRTQSMLRYKNLPDTIPHRDFVYLMQTNGFSCIPDPKFTDGKLYAFFGGLGGEPNPYYMPTICTVANPALHFSKTLKIDEECVIIPHDSMYMGLLPLFKKYANLITETLISLRIADINTRMATVFSGDDDRTLSGARTYISEIENGKLGVVTEDQFLEGIRVHNNGKSSERNIPELIEFYQYLKASWYNDLGLNANYNMKREAITANESQLNDDALLPFVDDILSTQNRAFEKLNSMYGTNISVEYNSAWEDRQITQESEIADAVETEEIVQDKISDMTEQEKAVNTIES